MKAKNVMTKAVVSVGPDASVQDIATLLERNRIKRVPVLRHGKLVGIVSRANLLHGLAARGRQARKTATRTPKVIREAIIAEFRNAGLKTDFMNGVVEGGVAHLWGWVESAAERRAIALAARRAPGVRRVENHLAVLPSRLIGVLGAQ